MSRRLAGSRHPRPGRVNGVYVAGHGEGRGCKGLPLSRYAPTRRKAKAPHLGPNYKPVLFISGRSSPRPRVPKPAPGRNHGGPSAARIAGSSGARGARTHWASGKGRGRAPGMGSAPRPAGAGGRRSREACAPRPGTEPRGPLPRRCGDCSGGASATRARATRYPACARAAAPSPPAPPPASGPPPDPPARPLAPSFRARSAPRPALPALPLESPSQDPPPSPHWPPLGPAPQARPALSWRLRPAPSLPGCLAH